MAGELASLEHEDDAGLLVYSATLGARPMSIFYIFVGDKLVRAKYVLAETYVNAMNYVSAGDELRDSVTKKYGEPKEHNEFWSGDLYRDHPAEKGMAVLAGELSIFTSWTSGDTQITLAVTGENYEANVSLEYMSRQFAQLEDDFRSAAILDDL